MSLESIRLQAEDIKKLPKGCPHGCHTSAACSRCEEINTAVDNETERCVRVIAAFIKLSGSRKSALIAEICGEKK